MCAHAHACTYHFHHIIGCVCEEPIREIWKFSDIEFHWISSFSSKVLQSLLIFKPHNLLFTSSFMLRNLWSIMFSLDSPMKMLLHLLNAKYIIWLFSLELCDFKKCQSLVTRMSIHSSNQYVVRFIQALF